MLGMPGPLGTLIDLLAVLLGFGAIVFFHELGHFLAARWAGIRVLTFAVGFGPALVSYRRGIGFRKGSTAPDLERRLRDPSVATLPPAERNRVVSHTEYRLSALPFGGYVQMLGQDDLDPGAVSDASDSYQNAPVWKRMVVISAGVVMNIILAAVLFVIVFMAGLRVEPPVIGEVLEGSPAAVASYTGPDIAVADGLHPGDRIVSIDGHEPNRFDSVALKVAMAKKGASLPMIVERGGARLPYSVTPEKGEFSGLLEIGVMPQRSSRLITPASPTDLAMFEGLLARRGLEGLRPGDTVVAVDGEPVDAFVPLASAFAASGGTARTLTIERAGDGGTERLDLVASPVASMQRAQADVGNDEIIGYDHLLGLTPVLRVAPLGEPRQGLEHGDIIRRVGSIEFPSEAAGIAEIRASRNRAITLEVLRAGADGSLAVVPIDAKVTADGTVGFTPGTTADVSTLLSLPPATIVPVDAEAAPISNGARAWVTRAGMRVLSVDGKPVATFRELRDALSAIAAAAPAGPLTVEIAWDLPFGPEAERGEVRTASWTLGEDDRAAIAELGWESPVPEYFFEPAQAVLQAEGPIDAIGLGLDETKRVMASVYVTFLRLTQGSLEVQHIKGPVGIAHIGTVVADRGLIWMLFFLGMISVNLAVVNFLPLPIVDGGQFLMLCYEAIRGKPVPLAVQSAVMTAGLVLIVSVFLVVTFNDLRALLGV
jgi:regulator of sigma E protease